MSRFIKLEKGGSKPSTETIFVLGNARIRKNNLIKILVKIFVASIKYEICVSE